MIYSNITDIYKETLFSRTHLIISVPSGKVTLFTPDKLSLALIKISTLSFVHSEDKMICLAVGFVLSILYSYFAINLLCEFLSFYNKKTFLGDSAFDTIQIYYALFQDFGFEKAFIPLKNKLALPDAVYPP